MLLTQTAILSPERPAAGADRPLPALDHDPRRLPILIHESRSHRLLFVLSAIAVAGIFAAYIGFSFVPAHGGVDQNGYIVGGKMMARTGTTKLAPRDPYNPDVVDPYQFVGLMWVGIDLATDQERFYPKYPIGLPALVASAFVIGGEKWGPWLSFWINPLCMTLGVFGTFFLARTIIGSFGAVLAEAIFATSPITSGLTNNPSSHASTVCVVVWGMFLLVRWWQSRGAWRAALAGFLLGYAYTIRYTEGLLVLPVVGAALLAMRWRETRSWVEAGLLLTWWAIPVLILTVFNLKAMGTVTGYDPTNESWGFSFEYLWGDGEYAGNWETMLRQFNHVGLVFVFPTALLSLFWMWLWNWRITLLAWLWIIPNCFIYGVYYWAPDGYWTGYMRFFLTVFPGLIILGLWAVMLATRYWSAAPSLGVRGWLWVTIPRVALGGLVALIILLNLRGSLTQLEGDQRQQLFLDRTTFEVKGPDKRPDVVPPGSIVFSHDYLLHQLQFTCDFVLYTPPIFDANTLRQRIKQEATDANPLHQERSLAIEKRLGDDLPMAELQRKLTEAQKRIITEAIAHRRRVFFIFPIDANVGRPISPPQVIANSLYRLMPGNGGSWLQATYDLKPITRWCYEQPIVVRKEQPKPGAARKRLPTVPQPPPQLQSWMLVEVVTKPPPPAKPGG